MAAARTALQVSTPRDPAEVDATLPLPRLAGGPALMAGAVRGLLVTPWFAAAMGFVVAAGLWIYSPHAELKFPPSAVGVTPCQAAGCGLTTDQGGGALATTTRQPMPHSAKSAGKGAHPDVDGTAVASLRFSYTVLWQSAGKFGVLISVSGRRAPHAWKLTFAMPGDQISEVIGAAWHSAGADRGTASRLSATSPGHWQWGNGDHGDVSDASARGRRPDISFIVVGQGTPVVPTGCSLNGASCAFS